MSFDFSKLLDGINLSTKITLDKVLEVHGKSPKRICLKSSHSNALRKTNFDNSNVKWALFIPFDNSIKKIFEKETGLQIYGTKSGRYWCPMEIEDDYNLAKTFQTKYNSIVFLRDNLDLSIALSEHLDDDGERTQVGEFEYQAKYQSCKKSRKKIVALITSFIQGTPFFKDCKHICAVPSSDPRKFNLPERLVKMVANSSDIADISDNVNWSKRKRSLKELPLENKWSELENTDLEIEIDSKIKTVILVDDLYQSGTTMQFVAMKLKNAGINKVYGLSIVKSRRDTDNN